MKILCRNHEKLIYKDRLEVYFKGVFIYKYGNVGLMSVELFLEDFLNSTVDFKTIFGCFWIIITDKSDGKKLMVYTPYLRRNSFWIVTLKKIRWNENTI